MPLTKEEFQKMVDEQKEACKKDPSSWTAFIWPDAKVLMNHSPVAVGHAAIEAHYKAKKEKCPDVEVKFAVDDVINEGDLAIADGSMKIFKDGKEIDCGKFLHVLKFDGQKYKTLRVMNNTNRPMECHGK